MVPLLTVLIVAVAIAYYWQQRSRPYDGDSRHYIAIAEGRMSEVHEPFANRVLDPAIAGFLARTTGLSLDASFFVTNVVSLTILISVGLIFVMGRIGSVGLTLAIMLSPLPLLIFRDICMPDCLHAALAAVFFLVLERGRWWYAMPVLFLLQVARESTVLLTFFVVLVAAYRRKWKLAGAAVLVTLLGMAVVGRITSQALGNVHNASTLVYFVGKVPLNFLPNVFGIRIWTNTHAKNNPNLFPDEPLVTFELPTWLPSGSMRQVGIYNFDPSIPLANAALLLTLLGVMPSLALSVITRMRWRLVREDELSFAGLVALLYGLAAYLLSPALGTSVGRYISYAWPMAWIACPELLVRYFNMSKQLIVRLTWLQAIACWTPYVLKVFGADRVTSSLIAIAVAVPCHVLAIKILRQNRIS